MTDLRRYDDWLTWLRARGETDPELRVVFVGGSAVTGGYDDHSDLDVEVLATPGESTAAYDGCSSRRCATSPSTRSGSSPSRRGPTDARPS